MKIDLFQMERSQCLLENVVAYNLPEAGVAPLRDAGLRIEERSYDTDHRLIPPMAEDAAEFAL